MTKMEIIEYYKKSVYGKMRFYLADPRWSEAFYEISGRRTLQKSDLDAFAKLGFKVEEIIVPNQTTNEQA